MGEVAGPTSELLRQRLQEKLQPVLLEVIDESWEHSGHMGANESGVGTHFRVRISSAGFIGKSPVARHRLVYDALQDFLDQGLHALAIEASLPPG
jgi:BolA family transcriptional regulator, general stress-responsive regulator